MASMGIGSREILTDFFFPTLEGAFDKTWVSKVIGGSPMSSNKQTEEHRFLGSVPPMTKWTGQRVSERLQSKVIRVTNETWTTGLNIPIDDLRRQNGSQIQKRVQELAVQAVDFFDERLSNFIISGNAATYGSAYDTQYYFDTDHVDGKSGTLKNDLTSTEVAALNFNAAANPTESEMSQAILGVIAYMFNMKNNQGQPMNGNARKWLVMVPIHYYGAAIAAASSPLVKAASGATTTNSLVTSGFDVEVVCNPRLGVTNNVFFVFRVDGATPPLIIQEELPITLDQLAEGSEYEYVNREHNYTVEWTGGFGYGQWQFAARATALAD